MNRRQFLAALAAVPMLVSQLPELTAEAGDMPAVPLDWLGAQKFQVTFPGQVWEFLGHLTVVSETELNIQPTGPMTITGQSHEALGSNDAIGALVTRDDAVIGVLTDIRPQELERLPFDVFSDAEPVGRIQGLKPRGTLTITGKWL